MIGGLLFVILSCTGFGVLFWYLNKLGKEFRQETIRTKKKYAQAQGMIFDESTRDAKALVRGFSLYRLGFTKRVYDVFKFRAGTTQVTLGRYNYQWIGNEGSGTIDFALLTDAGFDFQKQHFLDFRHFGAGLLRRRVPLVDQLPQQCMETLKTRRWEIETRDNQVLVYSISYQICESELDSYVADLKMLIDAMKATSEYERRH